MFMKVWYVCVAVLVFAGMTNASVLAQRRGPSRGNQQRAAQQGWISSLDEGMSEARKTGKPLMVVIRCQP